jgi:hypothetical protein
MAVERGYFEILEELLDWTKDLQQLKEELRI